MVKRRLVTLSFALLLTACDPITPPFMKNALATPIDVTITYTNAVETRDTWQPQMEVACGRDDAQLTSLSVRAGRRVIHHLDQADIGRMLRSVSDPRKVVWEIRLNSIVPVPKR